MLLPPRFLGQEALRSDDVCSKLAATRDCEFVNVLWRKVHCLSGARVVEVVVV